MNQAPAARVFVALGSNIDPAARLQLAARALKEHFPDAQFSRCYRNPTFGFDGPDFINGVAGFSTALPVGAVLPVLRDIESRCGRAPAAPKWAPRAMDIDLLLYGDLIGSGPGYTLPRPDLVQRIYMLGPLAQWLPELLYPPSGPTLGELWARFPHPRDALIPLELDLNAV